LCWGAKPRYADCGNESSMERKFLGAKVTWNFRSQERKFSGAKVPSMELSFLGAKVRGNESSIIRHRVMWFSAKCSERNSLHD